MRDVWKSYNDDREELVYIEWSEEAYLAQAKIWAGNFMEDGVPTVVQWLTHQTRNYEVVGSVPGLAQWVKDPALP